MLHEGVLYLRINLLEKNIWYESILGNVTNEFLHLLFLLLSLKEHTPLLIHNVEKHLSPRLTQLFVKTFFLISELKNVQCIITSEETSLLNTNILKKNEMWFVTSSELGASRLISYDCFFFEKDKDIEKAYLNGEFASF